MAEVLIVDDERIIRNSVKSLLLAEGFDVRTAKTGDEALAAFREKRPDLVLLDIMMPGRNGFSVCSEIRSLDPLTPVIFLTAKTGEAEQVRGFGLGADDYVSKTASEAELVARVRRAIERSSAYNTAAKESRQIAFGDTIVDFDFQTVSCGGKEKRLTKMEADLLWLLTVERGRLVHYDEIVEVLKASGFNGDAGAVQTNVCRLKKKLGSLGNLLRAERGIGYALMS